MRSIQWHLILDILKKRKYKSELVIIYEKILSCLRDTIEFNSVIKLTGKNITFLSIKWPNSGALD